MASNPIPTAIPSSTMVQLGSKIDPAHFTNKETQRQAFWHLHSLLGDAGQYCNLDQKLWPNISPVDLAAMAVLTRVWLKQDGEIADMEEFLERFNFNDNGEKKNLLDVFHEEQRVS